ncbi:hypothetical protein GQ53DRAFT_639692, partial [Thozetella sp. PMI_491]
YIEAEAMYRQVLELKTKVLGAKHLDTLTSISNLANILTSINNVVQAKAMYRQVLKIQTKVLGVKYPYTLTSINNVMYTLDRQG